MRLSVTSTVGNFDVDNLSDNSTCWDLKLKLWGEYKDAVTDMPSPAEQTLIFGNKRLVDSLKPMQASGVTDGSILVLLRKRIEPASAASPQEPFPTLDDVERAVRAEGDRCGQHVSVAPAASSSRRTGRGRIEAQLQEVMEALQGLDGVAAGDAHERIARLLRSASLLPVDGNSGTGGAAAVIPVVAEEVTVPEPSGADMQVLADMGFSQRAARRALLLNRNMVNNAANYLLAHGGDGDIEAEPSESDLRAVYRARNVRLAQPRPAVAADEESVALLVSMGFTEAGARHALVRHENDLESAVNLLTSMPVGWGPEPEPAQEAPAQQAEHEDTAPAGQCEGDAMEGATHGDIPASAVGDEQGGTAASVSPAAPTGDAAGSAVQSAAGQQGSRDNGSAGELLQHISSVEADAGHPASGDGAAGAEVGEGEGEEGSTRDGGAAPITPPSLPEARAFVMARSNVAGGDAEGGMGPMQVLGNLTLLEPLLADMMGSDGAAAGINWERSLPRSGSAHMSGALPILSTGGGGDIGGFDQLGFNGMRWPTDGSGPFGGFGMEGMEVFAHSGELGSDDEDAGMEDYDVDEDDMPDEDEDDMPDEDDMDDDMDEARLVGDGSGRTDDDESDEDHGP